MRFGNAETGARRRLPSLLPTSLVSAASKADTLLGGRGIEPSLRAC